MNSCLNDSPSEGREKALIPHSLEDAIVRKSENELLSGPDFCYAYLTPIFHPEQAA
jgi:hypothetical protein